jgi:hypothetical protein
MRARAIAIAATGILGTATAAVIARQLIKRRRLAAEGVPKYDDDTIDAILVVEDTLGEIYDYTEMAAGLPPQAQPLDERAQGQGENWFEALHEQAVEYGPEPEEVLVFFEEVEVEPASDVVRDSPPADRGSGGPRGA